MPIKSISMIPAPGRMVHICAACGAEHTVSFDRGAQKTRTGPFALRAGDTLVVRVDATEPASVAFAAADFPDLLRVTAAQLAAKLNTALPGVHAHDDAGGVLIESASVGGGSRIDVVDGSARPALGFASDGLIDPCSSRPVLGVSLAARQLVDKNLIALRRCNDCGATECLVRTFDAAAPQFDGTHLKEHRKAVNALAEHCKSRGWSHPHVAELHAAETTPPLDIHAAFLDEVVVLPRFVRPRAGSGTPRTPDDSDGGR